MNEQSTTQPKNKKPFIGLIVAAMVLLAGGITTAVVIANNEDKPKQSSAHEHADDHEHSENTNLVTFTGQKDKTVLEQLQAEADSVDIKESSYGPYVDSINGVVGGTDGKYWTFYVDGQMANIGAAEYKTKGGEKVEWKFE